MASDKQQVRNAVEQHRELLDAGSLSNPLDERFPGIVCSYEGADPKEQRTYRSEALVLADIYREMGYTAVEVAINAKRTDVIGMLKNPRITDIVTIGQGNISELFLPPSCKGGAPLDMDWYQLSLHINHLKQGLFVQRTCGLFSRRVSIPLGTFAVSDQRNVIAPVGYFFNPRGLNHEDNNLLRPAFDEAVNSTRMLMSHFNRSRKKKL